MSRFSQRVEQAMADPEYVAGWHEAEAELAALTVERIEICVPSVQASIAMNPAHLLAFLSGNHSTEIVIASTSVATIDLDKIQALSGAAA